ncbi:hypothetical protein C8J56DRAFT_883442 [Mycena floridula]|nr:hypothetical protein C8J56DRAFT_883442 [Mycena floridula]
MTFDSFESGAKDFPDDYECLEQSESPDVAKTKLVAPHAIPQCLSATPPPLTGPVEKLDSAVEQEVTQACLERAAARDEALYQDILHKFVNEEYYNCGIDAWQNTLGDSHLSTQNTPSQDRHYFVLGSDVQMISRPGPTQLLGDTESNLRLDVHVRDRDVRQGMPICLTRSLAYIILFQMIIFNHREREVRPIALRVKAISYQINIESKLPQILHPTFTQLFKRQIIWLSPYDELILLRSALPWINISESTLQDPSLGAEIDAGSVSDICNDFYRRHDPSSQNPTLNVPDPMSPFLNVPIIPVSPNGTHTIASVTEVNDWSHCPTPNTQNLWSMSSDTFIVPTVVEGPTSHGAGLSLLQDRTPALTRNELVDEIKKFFLDSFEELTVAPEGSPQKKISWKQLRAQLREKLEMMNWPEDVALPGEQENVTSPPQSGSVIYGKFATQFTANPPSWSSAGSLNIPFFFELITDWVQHPSR